VKKKPLPRDMILKLSQLVNDEIFLRSCILFPFLRFFLFLIFFYSFWWRCNNLLPLKNGGFVTASGGVTRNVHFFQEPYGVHCQNPGNLGSCKNVNVKISNCDICRVNGPPVKARNTA
jgi:hypothetical protein